VGIAGTDEKQNYWLTILALIMINYKTTKDINQAVKKRPDGVDVYYDNV
jgi:NADPH-dependent curcumin reductase CurA